MTVYVLTQVDEKVLHAFIPFWDITGIQIPIDYETGERKYLHHSVFCIKVKRNSEEKLIHPAWQFSQS